MKRNGALSEQRSVKRHWFRHEKIWEEQTTHLFQSGDKVYPSKIEVNLSKDIVTIAIVACDTCNKTDPPTYNKANVVFQFPERKVQLRPARGRWKIRLDNCSPSATMSKAVSSKVQIRVGNNRAEIRAGSSRQRNSNRRRSNRRPSRKLSKGDRRRTK